MAPPIHERIAVNEANIKTLYKGQDKIEVYLARLDEKIEDHYNLLDKKLDKVLVASMRASAVDDMSLMHKENSHDDGPYHLAQSQSTIDKFMAVLDKWGPKLGWVFMSLAVLILAVCMAKYMGVF